MRQLILLACCVAAACAFTPGAHQRKPALFQPTAPSQQQRASGSRRAIILQGGARGVATSPAGKASTVESVKGLLDTSEMIFTVPASSLTVLETQTLRRSLPEGATAKVVKNKLMARALEGTDYETAGASMLQGANMWFFIEDSDIGASIKAYNAFLKESGKIETHSILGGILEGKAYDTNGVKAIGELPSKQDLYAAIAVRLKGIPTKVARVIKAPSSKLARAIKLATDENNK